MTDNPLYISPEYNPHSLMRDWGFFVEKQRPEIYAALSEPLGVLRHTLVRTIAGIAAQNAGLTQTTALTSVGNVSIDVPVADAKALYCDVGLDVLTLALLADVPLHRPLHINQNSLIGHWRWLRLVWRRLAVLPPEHEGRHGGIKATVIHPPDNQLTTALAEGRNNLAVASLRQMFHTIGPDHGPEKDQKLLHSFLANLTLFCPFIGYDLLCRHGLFTHPWTKGSIE